MNTMTCNLLRIFALSLALTALFAAPPRATAQEDITPDPMALEPAAAEQPQESETVAPPPRERAGMSTNVFSSAADIRRDPELGALLEEANRRDQAGDTEIALSLYRRVWKQRPDNAYVAFNLGTALVQANRYEEALEILQPLLEKLPDDYFVKNNVAWIYATSKDPSVRNGEKAVALAREALLLAPGDYHVWNTLSEAYYVSAEYDKALRAAQAALQMAADARVNDREKLIGFSRQVQKCRQAVVATSLVE